MWGEVDGSLFLQNFFLDFEKFMRSPQEIVANHKTSTNKARTSARLQFVQTVECFLLMPRLMLLDGPERLASTLL